MLTFDLCVCEKQAARTSPGSVCSLRGGGVPGSPAVTIVVCIAAVPAGI